MHTEGSDVETYRSGWADLVTRNLLTVGCGQLDPTSRGNWNEWRVGSLPGGVEGKRQLSESLVRVCSGITWKSTSLEVYFLHYMIRRIRCEVIVVKDDGSSRSMPGRGKHPNENTALNRRETTVECECANLAMSILHQRVGSWHGVWLLVYSRSAQ